MDPLALVGGFAVGVFVGFALGAYFAVPRTGRAGLRLNRQARRISRNEPCFCGSGVKFKKCCGRRDR